MYQQGEFNQQKQGYPGDIMVLVSKPSSQVTFGVWWLSFSEDLRSALCRSGNPSCEQLWFTECWWNPFHDRIQKPTSQLLFWGRLLMKTFQSKEDQLIKVSKENNWNIWKRFKQWHIIISVVLPLISDVCRDNLARLNQGMVKQQHVYLVAYPSGVSRVFSAHNCNSAGWFQPSLGISVWNNQF